MGLSAYMSGKRDIPCAVGRHAEKSGAAPQKGRRSAEAERADDRVPPLAETSLTQVFRSSTVARPIIFGPLPSSPLWERVIAVVRLGRRGWSWRSRDEMFPHPARLETTG